ncbi:MAG: tetratricopeptide repeat protein [Deltaproteobacteria bacterium]|nr:tetratricopeptide repeat protein [Deltaproteobacteria bacterium]
MRDNSLSEGSTARRGRRLLLVIVAFAACEQPPPREARPAAVAAPAPVAVVPGDAKAAGPGGGEVLARTDAVRSLDALSADERRRYQAAVAEGRRLHGTRDYEGAVEAYGRALDIAPGQARTLSEQGWAALFADRLDEAAAMLAGAEAAAGDDTRLLASILYNRGRVAEAQGKTDVAVDAYQRSLRLRPHPAAYRHLTGLPGGTRYVFGPAVRGLQGPYGSLAELCAEERRLSADQRPAIDADTFSCLHDASQGLAGPAVDVPRRSRLPAPWTAIRFIETQPSAFGVRIHAALRTEQGWFVLPDTAVLSRGTPGMEERPTALSAHSEELVGGGAAEMVLEVETQWKHHDGGTELESERHRVEFLCGIGPSGRPSCTGAIPRATDARRRARGRVLHTRWAVDREIEAGTTLILGGDPEKLDEPAAALLGRHGLSFP